MFVAIIFLEWLVVSCYKDPGRHTPPSKMYDRTPCCISSTI